MAEQLKLYTLADVLAKAGEYLQNPDNLALISRAYEKAQFWHQGQHRRSGEEYIYHPLAVAYMLAEIKAGPATIAAGLLHDTVEDTDYSLAECAADFGPDVASLVEGVTKISKLKYMTEKKALARTHQKMLLAMAKDIRVVLIKIMDRVHNMRTLAWQVPEKQKLIAQETLDLYAPLAHRIGMYRIKGELEDLSLKYLDPARYEEVSHAIEETRQARETDIEAMKSRLERLLLANNIKNYALKGRVKTVYSVAHKMAEKEVGIKEIYDLMALRVIVGTVEECYLVLGLIHGLWAPLPRRIKDYIALPKPNMYQSLHTTVIGLGGKMFEIQIRTEEMDQVAELGVAAHWAYKEDDKNYSPEKEQRELFEKLNWYKSLLEYVEAGEKEDEDPVSLIKTDIFEANVFVFSPKGDVFDFPTGATPIDFAYRIHTEVGNHTTGAIVNGKIVPLTYQLKTGDVIEIKTNKNFNGPAEQWLQIVKTSHAKHKIIALLNKKKRTELEERGREAYQEALKGFPEEPKLTDKIVEEKFEKSDVHNLSDFYYQIGKGVLSARGAINRLNGQTVVDDEALLAMFEDDGRRTPHRRHFNDYGLILAGIDRAKIKLAQCCHPVYGDPVAGFVTKGEGIAVHRTDCPNLARLDKSRFIGVKWDSAPPVSSFVALIEVISFNRKNIIADLITLINATTGISMISINSRVLKNSDLLTKLKVAVANKQTLENVIANFKNIADVYDVVRSFK